MQSCNNNNYLFKYLNTIFYKILSKSVFENEILLSNASASSLKIQNNISGPHGTIQMFIIIIIIIISSSSSTFSQLYFTSDMHKKHNRCTSSINSFLLFS